MIERRHERESERVGESETQNNSIFEISIAFQPVMYLCVIPSAVLYNR